MEPRLPLDVVLRVLALLPPNDLALSGRLVCKSAAQHLRTRHPGPRPDDPQQAHPHPTVVDLALPLPQHAASEATLTHARGQLRQLPLHRKLPILCTAAASGCETNLAVALLVLQPCPRHLLFRAPRQQPAHCVGRSKGTSSILEVDVGTAAARAGHAHLLPWLVEHRCPLDPRRTLVAAAQYCDLAGLQTACNVLRSYTGTNNSSSGSSGTGSSDSGSGSGSGGSGSSGSTTSGGSSGSSSNDAGRFSTGDVDEEVLNAAAESLTPDALAKLQWLLDGCRAGRAATSHCSSTSNSTSSTSSGGGGVVGNDGAAPLSACHGDGRCALTLRTAAAACRSGDLLRLQWLHARGCPVVSPMVLAAALEHAPLPVAQWLVDHLRCTSCSC